MAGEIEELRFKIVFDSGSNKNIEKAIKNIDALQKQLSSIKSSDLQGLKELATNLKDVANSIKTINSLRSKSFSSSIKDTRKTVDGVTESVNKAKDAVNGLVSAFKDSFEKLNKDKTPAPQLPGLPDDKKDKKSIWDSEQMKKYSQIVGILGGDSGKLGSIATALGAPEVAIVLSSLNLIYKALSKVVSTVFTLAKGVAKVTANVVLLPFKGLIDSIKEIYSSLQNLGKRIARLAITKAIRRGLTLITDGIKTGIENLYQYSKIMGTEFAPSMDKATTAMLYFKNSIGAMVAPLINYFAPILDVIIDKIVEFVNSINQMLAKITGASTWTKAIKYTTEYAESANSASKAVKNLSISADELNVVSDNASGASGSGVGDYSQMFEEVELDNTFASFIDDIKEAINNGDWNGVGAILGGKLNDLILGLDINGYATEFADKINNIFSVAYGFLTSANFGEYGVKFASLLNTFFGELDVGMMGTTFGTSLQKVFDFAYGVFTELDWGMYGTKLSEYVANWFKALKGEKIGATIHEAISGLLDFVEKFLTNKTMWKNMIETMGGVIKGLDLPQLLIKALDLITALADMLNDHKVLAGFRTGFADLLNTLTSPKVKTALKNCLIALFKAVFNVIFSVEGAIADSFIHNFQSMLSDVWTGGQITWLNMNGSSNTANAIQENANELGRGSATAFWNGFTQSQFGGLSGVVTMFSAFSERTTNMSRSAGLSAVDAFRSVFTDDTFEPMTESFELAWNKLPEFVNNSMIKMDADFDKHKKAIVGNFGNIADLLAEKTKGGFNKIIEYTEKTTNAVVKGINTSIKSIKNLGSIKLDGKSLGTISTDSLVNEINIARLANGGMVNSGSLFVAGENGSPEFVTDFNGKSGVMNTDEMSVAIGRAVFDAMSSAMGNGNQNITINLDGREIWSNQASISRDRGFNLGLGGFNV